MERLIAIVIIFCLFMMLILPEPICAMGSGALRSAYQALFFWETRNWSTIEGDHCIIKYQEGDEKNAVLTLQEMERFYEPLGEYFGYFPEKKVPVAIYRDKSSLNNVFGWGSDTGAMGVYWAGVIRLLSPDDWLGELNRAAQEEVFRQQGPIAHEYIHLLVDYKTRGNYPRWLTEGLAQFGEKHFVSVAAEADTREKQPAFLEISLADLDKKFDDPQWQEYCYAVSEDMVSFLVENYGADCIPLLLEELGKGEELDSVFSKILGVDSGGFLKKYYSSA
ncbi:MAG TPA: hypothetical protein GXX59_00420 [Syntrophomonadaceae bacterium]|nr:hypothetical protein [Syntrophomonadaceae bacterium]